MACVGSALARLEYAHDLKNPFMLMISLPTKPIVRVPHPEKLCGARLDKGRKCCLSRPGGQCTISQNRQQPHSFIFFVLQGLDNTAGKMLK